MSKTDKNDNIDNKEGINEKKSIDKRSKIVLIIGMVLILLAFIVVGVEKTKGPQENLTEQQEQTENIDNRDEEQPEVNEDKQIDEQEVSKDEEDKEEKGLPLQLIDFTLKDLDGHEFTLSESYGKNIKLTFWRIGCEPCEEEMENLANIYEKYQGNEDFEFVLVNTRNTEGEIKEHMKENNFKFRVLVDNDKEVTEMYNIERVPTSLFVDKEGKMVRQHIGALNTEDLKEIMAIE